MSVDLGVSGGVATLSLDRPDEFNAIDIGLARSLERRVNEIAASDAEIVVLRASGRGFCAGGDVRAMAAAADPSAYLDQLVEAAHRALTALRALPQPVVARVQGRSPAAASASCSRLISRSRRRKRTSPRPTVRSGCRLTAAAPL